MIRVDNPDAVFLNRAGKYRAVVAELKEAHARNQPVLVGTTSIEVSEMLGEQLNEAGIHHEVLNAKQHEREATIIAQAGRPGAVTLATTMACRGPDLVLGRSIDSALADLGRETGEPVDRPTRARLTDHSPHRHNPGPTAPRQ